MLNVDINIYSLAAEFVLVAFGSLLLESIVSGLAASMCISTANCRSPLHASIICSPTSAVTPERKQQLQLVIDKTWQLTNKMLFNFMGRMICTLKFRNQLKLFYGDILLIKSGMVSN